MFMNKHTLKQSSNLSCKLEKNLNSFLLGNWTMYNLQIRSKSQNTPADPFIDHLISSVNGLEIPGLLGILDSWTCS